jgi:hypothetical protein
MSTKEPFTGFRAINGKGDISLIARNEYAKGDALLLIRYCEDFSGEARRWRKKKACRRKTRAGEDKT